MIWLLDKRTSLTVIVLCDLMLEFELRGVEVTGCYVFILFLKLYEREIDWQVSDDQARGNHNSLYTPQTQTETPVALPKPQSRLRGRRKPYVMRARHPSWRRIGPGRRASPGEAWPAS